MLTPARKSNTRHAIALMVALAVPIATIPRATACECAANLVAEEQQCPCCAPEDALPACCAPDGTTGCCSEETGKDCDCPKCQGDHLLKLNLFAKSDRPALEGHSVSPILVAIVPTTVDFWVAARISERPPPEVYLARHGPQLERLCRWLI